MRVIIWSLLAPAAPHAHSVLVAPPPVGRPSTRGRLLTGALLCAAIALASPAAAQTAPAPQAAPAVSAHLESAPLPTRGASPANEIEQDLTPWQETDATYKKRINELERQLDDAKELDYREEVIREMAASLEALKARHDDFRRRTMRRRSSTLMGVGFGLAGLGTIAAITAVALVFNYDRECIDACSGTGDPRVVIPMFVLGAGAVGAGIPVAVKGMRKVPRDPDYSEPVATVRLVVSPGAGAAAPSVVGAALCGSF